jgi:hypothetical protein
MNPVERLGNKAAATPSHGEWGDHVTFFQQSLIDIVTECVEEQF